MTESIIRKVREIASPVISSLGLELVDVTYSGGGRKGVLRVYIHKPEGVTLDDCEQVSRILGHALDVEDPIPVSYVLEVSSPGLDRPLRHRSDFERNRGRLVRVSTFEPLAGNQKRFVGRIGFASETDVELILADGEVLRVPFSAIELAKLEIEF